MANHSIFSPSSASRWLKCPGSIRLSEGIEDETSEYAALGTALHAVASEAFELGTFDASFFIGLEVEGFVVTEEHLPWVQPYLDRLKAAHVAGWSVSVEQRVDLSDYTGEEGGGGTADALVWNSRTRTLGVDDLKTGRGLVYATTPQLKLYALGAWKQYPDAEWFTLGIHQDRVGHFDSLSITADELRAFGEEVRAAAAAAKEPDAPLVPGESQCQWCRAKGTCPALSGQVLATVAPADVTEFKDLTAPIAPALLTDAEIAHALPLLDMIRAWCTDVLAEATRRQEAGGVIPGYKLVGGKKGARAWVDGSAPDVEEMLLQQFALPQKDVFTKTLISPTQASKLLGPTQYKRLEAYITQSTGKPACVPTTDKRPAINPVATLDEFSAITEEE